MLSKFVQRCARAAGFEIRRSTPTSDCMAWLLGFATAAGVTTILDIGANTGQFGSTILAAGWRHRLLSFEPLSTAHARLVETAARHPQWQVAPQTAVGARKGTAEINIAGNSQSSSLLPMLERHLTAASGSGYVGTETTTVIPLDEALADAAADECYMLKMDVQGFETEVLRGATKTMARIAVIYTEMSLQPLYAGEAVFTDLARDIMALGYRCVGLQPGYADAANREMLQVDGVFVRNS
jgi:FkbM family methyltransferase